MHAVQERLVELSGNYDLVNMKLSVIAKLVGVPHLQLVKHHRAQLIKKGLLKPQEGKLLHPREAGVTETSTAPAELLRIPILGSVNAGPATIYPSDQIEGYLRISPSLLRTKFSDTIQAFRAVGRSMNQAAINGFQTIDDGDYLIVDSKQFDPKNGDYIISSIDGMLNVKKYILDKGNHQIALLSESSDEYPPIVVHPEDNIGYMVSAKVVQVVKTPRFA